MHAVTRSVSLIVASLTAVLAACGAQPALNDVAYAGTFRYEYEHNTPTLVEDHYIVLDSAGGTIRGWYYGTTDDFDPAREGYLPGFFVTPMDDLRVSGDSIAFTLRPRALFASPVPLRYRHTAELPHELLQKWTGPSVDTVRSYSGTVTTDGITLEVDRRPRVFVREEGRK